MFKRARLWLLLPMLCAAAHGVSAQGLNDLRTFANPPVLENIQPRPLPGQKQLNTLRPPSGTVSRPAELNFTINVGYTDPKKVYIYNPNTGKNDPVRLRSYDNTLIAPIIEAYPSQTIRISLHNNLPTEDVTTCPPPNGRNHTIPSCFNVTNLHFHGLHVSPVGNSDNVLLEVSPGQKFEYEVNIPADHPAGTFWYHSHRHGSTALQVSSGMVGPLIVKGERTVTQARERGGFADIDTIFKQSINGPPLSEDILLFQQIVYACFDKDTPPQPSNRIVTTDGNPSSPWICPERDGKIEPGEVQYYSTQFGLQSWRNSGRYTMLTGRMQPRFGIITDGIGRLIKAGEVLRWRLIHGGARDTVNLQIVEAVGLAPGDSGPGVGAEAQLAWITQHCRGQTVQQWQFAVDGLTQQRAQVKVLNTLQPGYRSDILLSFPKQGTYCVLDKEAAPASTVNPRQQGKIDRLLASVIVTSGSEITTPSQVDHIVSLLKASNPDLQDVSDALAAGDLAAFVAHTDLTGVPAIRSNLVAFNIVFNPDFPEIPRFETNDVIYNPLRVDFRATVDTVEDWELTSKGSNHVFHIHVNPFQIIRIIDPQGNTLANQPGCDTAAPGDEQYCELTGQTRDTVFIKRGYRIFVRTAYTRYIGRFVLHCHILDHEDQGMMLNVELMAEGGDEALSARERIGIGHGAH
jgi:L-ascorbate oxidase